MKDDKYNHGIVMQALRLFTENTEQLNLRVQALQREHELHADRLKDVVEAKLS